MRIISDPHEKARLSMAYNGSRTYTDRAMTVVPNWAVAPMNWADCYRIVVDGNPVGDPIYEPDGLWKVMDALAEDLGERS